MNTPLYSQLLKYASNQGLRLHMPGHIGGPGFAADAFKALAALDVTEVPGLDGLHAGQGVIEEARRLLARAYGARESFFLVNGASSGVHALFMALKGPDAKALVPRNCHRSFFAGMVMAGTNPVYIPCQVNYEIGAALSVLPADVEGLLDIHHDAQAVFITSPSYYGTTCRITEIAAVCQKYDKPLLVDEAHGTHFYFGENMPVSAMAAGAAAVAAAANGAAAMRL